MVEWRSTAPARRRQVEEGDNKTPMANASKKEPLPPGLSGVAGEYFVAAELSRSGFIASITLRNARGIDILATRPEWNRTIGIQVKTSQPSHRAWPLSNKAEDCARPDLFFVNLNGRGEPSYHVVPTEKVADDCRPSHAGWLKTPGKNGKPHRDNAIRQFKDIEGQFLDRRDFLRA
jgi:hypothetical protein